ncbi:hypothetical protein OH76DRAFT_1246918 [Lentinus brumalis]|uniref:Uncharacterized protein n=1 Tax=Lentinus brumalis TaxID=2498619 RepID=A0A371CRU2_9APHY|nr:hypothetical protein OH76DRAFT_1246918 [Polyporus brumalis]
MQPRESEVTVVPTEPEGNSLDAVLLVLLPHVPNNNGDAPAILTGIPQPRYAVASMRTLLDNLARLLLLIPGCSSVSLAMSDGQLCVSATSSDWVRIRSQLSEWIRHFNQSVDYKSQVVELRDALGFSIYGAIYKEWVVLAREGCEQLIRGLERFFARQSPPGPSSVDVWLVELHRGLSAVIKSLPEDNRALGSMNNYRAIYAAVESLWKMRRTYSEEQEYFLMIHFDTQSKVFLKDITVVFETIRALTDDRTARHLPQGLELCWVNLPAPCRFEANMTEDRLTLLDSHLDRRINWHRAIKRMRRYIAPKAQQAYKYSLGLHPSSGECYVAEDAVPHCEMALVQYILDKKMDSVDYVACAPTPCWPCRAYTQVVFAVHNRPITLGNYSARARVELPWVCPPGVSTEAKQKLYDYCLWVLEQAVGAVYVQEEEEEVGLPEPIVTDAEAAEHMRNYTVDRVEGSEETEDIEDTEDTSEDEEDSDDSFDIYK